MLHDHQGHSLVWPALSDNDNNERLLTLRRTGDTVAQLMDASQVALLTTMASTATGSAKAAASWSRIYWLPSD